MIKNHKNFLSNAFSFLVNRFKNKMIETYSSVKYIRRKVMGRVLITGAFTGIGLAASRLFLERGWTVVMVGRDVREDIFTDLKTSYHDDVYSFVCDVTKDLEVNYLHDYVMKNLKGLDVIINNAGIITHGYLHQTSEDDWDAIMNTDVKSIYLTSKYFIPEMIKNKSGKIVNTASISGLAADYKMPVYNAAKGAVVNLTRAMALDYGEYGIRVNSVCPGATDTPMLKRGSIPYEEFARVNPLKRICEPEEIAKAMYFLSTDESSYCNGVNLPVTGGLEVHTGQPKG